MERPRGMPVEHTVSVRERTSKVRTAFPVGLLARVGGGCMELNGPAIISGGCLSVLVARAATGVLRAWYVRKRESLKTCVHLFSRTAGSCEEI